MDFVNLSQNYDGVSFEGSFDSTELFSDDCQKFYDGIQDRVFKLYLQKKMTVKIYKAIAAKSNAYNDTHKCGTPKVTVTDEIAQ